MRVKYVAGLAAVVLAISPSAAGSQVEFNCAQISGLNKFAIAKATQGQAIHQSWIDYINAGYATAEQIRYNGDIAWQQEWVDNYAAIIAALRQARYPCQP